MINLPKFLRAAGLGGIVLAAALGMTSSAFAGDSKDQRRAEEARAIRAAVARGEVMALPRILTLAQARVRGEVVKVELEHENGLLIYEIKILTAAGLLRKVELNARTGALVRIKED